MALNFSKMNFSVSFNPTSAFPLDARSYFESYDLALAAAAKAVEAGSTEGTLYFGQTLAVVENDSAQLYIIQPDKSLAEVGSKIVVDTNAFELTDEGVLNLLGFADAVAGAQLLKGSDGKLSWVKPDNTTVEGLQTTVAGLQADIKNLQDALSSTDAEGNQTGIVKDVADLEEAVGNETVYDEEGNVVTPATGIYKDIEDIETQIGDPANSELNQEATGLYAALDLKADKATTYTKTEVDTLIEEKIVEADHLRRVIVDSKEAIDENADDALLYIYMVPSGLEEDDNKYYEYVVLEAEDGTRTVEKVGSWEVSLDAYALKTEVNDLADVVAANKTTAENAVASEKARAEAAEKANADAIAVNAGKIADAEADILLLEENKADKGTTLADYGITDAYTKNEVYTKGEADQAIADKISEVNGGESAGEVLGQLNAYKKIVNMEVWGDEDGSGVDGNSRIDVLETNVNALAGAEANYINSVDDVELKVEGKKLSIISIDGTKINNLAGNEEFNNVKIVGTSNASEIVTLKQLTASHTTDINDLKIRISAAETNFENFVLKTQYEADLGEIRDILTWKEMS